MRPLGLILLLAATGCAGEGLSGAQYSDGAFLDDTGDPGADAVFEEARSLPWKDNVWEYKFKDHQISRLTLAGSQLFIETPDHMVIAMDRYTGRTDWMHRIMTDTPLDWPPVVAQGVPEEIRDLEIKIRQKAREIDDMMKEKGAGPETQKLQKQRNEFRERLRVAAFGDNVYFISRQVIYCLDRLRGNVVWSHRLQFVPSAQPYAIRNFVFVPGADLARVWALDVEKRGQEVTSYKASIATRENQVMNRPIYSEPSLYFVSHDGNLYSFNVTSGELNWTYGTERSLKSDPIFHVHREVTKDDKGKERVRETHIVFVGGMDNTFYAIESNGAILWKYECGAPMKSAAATTKDSVFVRTEDGALHALEIMPLHRDPKTNQPVPNAFKRNGNLRWKIPLGDRFLFKGKEHVYVMGPNREVFKIVEPTGEVVGRYPTRVLQHIPSNVSGDEYMYVANGAGYVLCLRESAQKY